MPPMGAPDKEMAASASSAAASAAAASSSSQGHGQGSAPLLLGLDLSTQSITAVLLEMGSHKLVATDSLNFDAELPKYGTVNGMHVGLHGRVTQPVMLWLDGLDKLLRRMDKGLLARVRAVSGSAQQHGSVYWNADGLQALRHMNPEDSLSSNLYDGFALADCPIWADSSTQVRVCVRT